MRSEALGRLAIPLVLVFVMWAVELANLVTAGSLTRFGIHPRTVPGLWGILFSPLLHAGLAHLIANTVPFLVLGWLVALRGRRDYIMVTCFVTLVGGGAVWLVGRPFSNHIGASGVIFGYLGFLLARGFFERSAQAILLSIVALLLYGGIIWGVLPTTPGVSWEGHLFGLLAGVMAAKLFTRPPISRTPR